MNTCAEVGPVRIADRNGREFDSPRWDSGTRAAAEGRDLVGVASRLSHAELVRWLQRMESGCCYHEAGVLREELDRRDPHRKRGTLWEFLSDETLEANHGG